MFCTNCGQEQRVNAKFCHDCGLPLQQTPAQNVHISQSNGQHGSATTNIRNFYVVSVGKFLLLSIVTFGLYPIYWFAKNWILIKDQEKANIHPIARAIFSVFFFSELAGKVLKSAKEKGYDSSYSSFLLAISYFVLNFLFRLPGNYWLLGLSSLLPFIPVLEAILYNNQKLQDTQQNYNKYGTGEIVTLIIGSIIWLFVLIGIFSQS